ncbi:hypothetical protein [Thermococcus piezophilus]|nr:hypothetical protein [Thermococcus piezophilus]
MFLSHCHYDHTGGLLEMLKTIGRRVPVIAHLPSSGSTSLQNPT